MTLTPASCTYPDPPLTDGVVGLRRWEQSDLACVEQASQDPAIPEGTTVPARYTEDEGRAWVQRQRSRAENGEGLSLAISKSDTGAAVGTMVLLLRPAAGTAAIGYWIIAPERGHGYASRAVTLLAAWAVTEAGFARVEAVVEPWNTASQRVLEKAGFKREGLLRSCLAFATRRADAWMYSLLPSDLGTQ